MQLEILSSIPYILLPLRLLFEILFYFLIPLSLGFLCCFPFHLQVLNRFVHVSPLFARVL